MPKKNKTKKKKLLKKEHNQRMTNVHNDLLKSLKRHYPELRGGGLAGDALIWSGKLAGKAAWAGTKLIGRGLKLVANEVWDSVQSEKGAK